MSSNRLTPPPPGADQPKPRRDFGLLLIRILVAGVSLWLLSLPLFPFVRNTTFNRYHLQTRSFAAWAVQAPIPVMYNFHNQVRLEPQPWDATPWSQPAFATINHFPIRVYTFGDHREPQLSNPDRRLLTARSTYRGHSLTTQWLAAESDDGGYELVDEVLP